MSFLPEEQNADLRENASPQEAGTSTESNTPPGRSGSKKKKKGGLNVLPRKGDGPFEVIRKFIFLMSAGVFVVCSFLIGKYFWDNHQNDMKNGGLQEQKMQAEMETTEPTEEEEAKHDYFNLLPSQKGFLEQNSEIVGWISIPTKDPDSASPIDYPVLQHKDEETGNEYYLDRDFFGNQEKAGAIFLDYRNHFDEVENRERKTPNSENLVIYGHNMHDYSMFGSLKWYINDETYYDNHPIVELDSNYRHYKYKIFGMIIVDVDDNTETKFNYWNTLDFVDEADFYRYVNEVKRRTVRLTDVDVKYGDQLLTLSTCNSTFSQGRLVLFARLVRDGEDLLAGCTSSANPNIKWPNSYYKWHKNTYDPNAEFVPYG